MTTATKGSYVPRAYTDRFNRTLNTKGLATRDRLLEGMERVLVTTPLYRLTIRDIAREAYMSAANFYQYFPTLDDALICLVYRLADRVLAERAVRGSEMTENNFYVASTTALHDQEMNLEDVVAERFSETAAFLEDHRNTLAASFQVLAQGSGDMHDALEALFDALGGALMMLGGVTTACPDQVRLELYKLASLAMHLSATDEDEYAELLNLAVDGAVRIVMDMVQLDTQVVAS